jgi:integrase
LDLADLDADELTEFYCAVLDPLETDPPKPDDLVDDEQDEAAGLSRAAEPPRLYTLRRLQEFHRFAQVQYGLETPDWSEIGEGAISATANPGFIQPTEYRHGLRLLAPDPSQQEIESVQDAFILLLAYRFGLRGSEAAALAQADWVELGGAVVVLVTGTHGKLKTRGSRRQVPLIGALDEHERAIIQRCFMHWEAESGGDNRVPIFFCASDKKRPLELQPVRERIITALRAATGNPRINLHHARHSLANLVGLNLLTDAGIGLWKGANPSSECATSTQRLLLSSTGCSRRNLWAVSRVLGHVQRGTTTGSYLHFLHDWAAVTVMSQCPSRFVEDHSIASRGVEDRDQWPQSASYLPELAPVPRRSFNAPTAGALVKYCRLRAQGMVAAAAGQHLQLAASVRLRVEHQLAQAGARLQGRVPIGDDRSLAADLDGALFLLSRVEPHRWAQLEIAAKSSDAPRQPLCPDPCTHIGRSRQILLWQRDHFQTLNYFLAELQWNKEQVVLYRPAKLDDRLSRWAEECGLLLHANVQGDRKVLQIDKAVVIQPNQVPVTYEHRVAMVRAAHNQVVRTNYELIVLWIAMCLAHSSVQSA